MEKTLIITVIVDGLNLNDIAAINDAIEIAVEDFENKRITIQLQDEPMITRR